MEELCLCREFHFNGKIAVVISRNINTRVDGNRRSNGSKLRQLLSAAAYSVAVFGAPGSTLVTQAINDHGEVAGWDGSDAFTYLNGTFTDIGSLGGSTITVVGINNAGQITGDADLANGGHDAFLYSNGHMTDIGNLGGVSVASAINASGQISGYSRTAAGDLHGFLYSNGHMTDIGTLGGKNTMVWGMNDSGEIVGQSDTAVVVDGNPVQDAFLYANGHMTDLGSMGGTGSRAFAINNSGEIVGEAYTPAKTLAFKDSGGTMTALALPGNLSRAVDINASGQIVGFYNNSSGVLQPFLYNGNGTWNDLGSLGGRPRPRKSITPAKWLALLIPRLRNTFPSFIPAERSTIFQR